MVVSILTYFVTLLQNTRAHNFLFAGPWASVLWPWALGLGPWALGLGPWALGCPGSSALLGSVCWAGPLLSAVAGGASSTPGLSAREVDGGLAVPWLGVALVWVAVLPGLLACLAWLWYVHSIYPPSHAWTHALRKCFCKYGQEYISQKLFSNCHQIAF